MLIYVPPHPLIKHWLAVARNEATPQPAFRSAISELGRLLIYECVRDWLSTVQGEVASPCGIADAECVDPEQPIKIVPILRAGTLILEQAATVIPSSQTYHVGMVRDEETLKPSTYLNMLPDKFSPDDKILVSDTMLATGGTIMAAMEEIMSRGASPSNVRIVSVVAAPPALQQLSKAYPGTKVYAAMIDAEVNDKGFIVPGLGDAGDRAFGTC